jgi:hypothetical protein
VRFYDLLDSHYFYTTKPLWALWAGDFGTEFKKCAFFGFDVDFVFVWPNILLNAPAEYSAKKCFWRYSRTLRPKN